MRATPDFDFQLGESAEMIREATTRFADERVAPLAEKADRRERPGAERQQLPAPAAAGGVAGRGRDVAGAACRGLLPALRAAASEGR